VPDPVEARLLALERAVHALEARFREPIEQDDGLVSAIANCIAGRVFAARDLFTLAGADQQLRTALNGVTSAKRLGKRLRTLSRCPAARTLQVQRVGRDDRGVLWAVTVSEPSDLHAGPRAGDDSAV
jgi:hypothetical protein